MKNKKLVLSVLSTTVVASMATSAMAAAPSAGLYLGGEVDKYYALENFVNDEFIDAFSADLANVAPENVVYVDMDGKAATLQTIIDEDDWQSALLDLNDEENLTTVFGDDADDEFAVVDEKGQDSGDVVTPDNGGGNTDVPAVDSATSSVEGKVVTISGTVENADDVRVTLIDKDNKSYEYLASEGQVEFDQETGEFTFTSAELTEGDWSYEVTAINGDVESDATKGTFKIEAPAELKVDSVTVNNLKQFTVVFNQQVDKTSAENEANYVFNGAALADGTTTGQTPAQAKAVLQADGKTVVVTLADAQAQQANKTIAISGVKDTKGNNVKEFSGSLYFFDAVVPTVLSAQQVSKNEVKVVFSEPINATSVATTAFSFDNNTYSIASVSPVTGEPNAVILALGTNIPAGEHTITVNPVAGAANNVEDAAGFDVLKADVKFTYTSDTTAPTLSVEEATQTKVTLKFNKPVKSNGIGAWNTDYTVYHTANNIPAYKGVAVLDADKQTLTVTFANPLPTGNVTIFVNNTAVTANQLTDLYGNAYVSSSYTATVSADTIAPTVTSVTAYDSNHVDVTFSEAVSGANVASNYLIKDSTGTIIPVTAAIQQGTSNTYRLTTGSLNGGTFTLSIAAGAIKDTSYNQNPIAAYSTAFVVADLIKPTVTTGSFSTDKTKVFVNFSEAMATTGANSVLSNSNYLIAFDGTTKQALPTGTTITLGADNKSVVITFPSAQASLVSGTSKIFVAQVADLAGNKTSSFENPVTLSTADLTGTNIVTGSVETTATNTIKFKVDTTLSAIDASKFTINGATAVSASYANNSDGTATVTVTANPSNVWGTDTTGLASTAVSIAANGLKTTNNVVNSNTITISNTAVLDKIAPALNTVVTGDLNSPANGKIDTITLTFSENLYAASVQEADFSVAGYEVTSVFASGAGVTLKVKEQSVVDSGAKPSVQVVGSVEDTSRNASGVLAAVTATDGVAPQAITISAQDSITAGGSVRLTANEALTTASWNAILAEIQSNTTGGANWVTGVSASNLTITPSADGVYATLQNNGSSNASINSDFVISATNVVDLAGNPATGNITIDAKN